MKLLERAPSNIEHFQNGMKIYEMFIKPAVLDLKRVGVHFAISSIFKEYSKELNLYAYKIKVREYKRYVLGKQKLAVGLITVDSEITRESRTFQFTVFYLGDHNVIGGVSDCAQAGDSPEMFAEVKGFFMKSQITQLIQSIDKYFGSHSYSLWHLFRDDQHMILNQIFKETANEIEGSFRQIYEKHFPIMQAVESLHIQLPRYFNAVMEFILNTDISRAIDAETINFEELSRIVNEVNRWKVNIDTVTIDYMASCRIEKLMYQWRQTPLDDSILRSIRDLLKTLAPLRLDLDIWKAQNIYFATGRSLLNEQGERIANQSETSGQWLELFHALGDLLTVRIG
jgi:hypothetical protein